MRIRIPMTGLALVALVAAFAVPEAAAAPPQRTFEVTVTNLTGGQPLTPPVVATHRGAYDAFDVGSTASEGVQQIAENGNGAPLLAELQGSKHVGSVLQTATGPLVPDGLPGSAMFAESVTFEITAGPGHRFLSYVSMLICTNDGFTGADAVKLPNHLGETVTLATFGYDAGTEINTEDFADIVPPCQALVGVTSEDPGTGMTNPALAEGGVIHHHAGVAGIADLVPAIHGWDTDAPVAEILITRTG